MQMQSVRPEMTTKCWKSTTWDKAREFKQTNSKVRVLCDSGCGTVSSCFRLCRKSMQHKSAHNGCHPAIHVHFHGHGPRCPIHCRIHAHGHGCVCTRLQEQERKDMRWQDLDRPRISIILINLLTLISGDKFAMAAVFAHVPRWPSLCWIRAKTHCELFADAFTSGPQDNGP